MASDERENKRIAKEGGEVALDARNTIDRRLGRSVVSPERASDYIKAIEKDKNPSLPFTDGEL